MGNGNPANPMPSEALVRTHNKYKFWWEKPSFYYFFRVLFSS